MEVLYYDLDVFNRQIQKPSCNFKKLIFDCGNFFDTLFLSISVGWPVATVKPTSHLMSLVTL